MQIKSAVLYFYKPLGKMSAVVDKNGNRTQYQYDAHGNVIRTVFADGTEELATYDVSQNRTSWTDRNGRRTVYEYDSLNRLVRTIIDPKNWTTC